MIFEELILENFAAFKGESIINLLPTPTQPIILIGGENGCGKTTILDAFQLVLFGPASKCSNRGKLSYETYLEKCINRETPSDEGARLKLTFQHYSGGAQKRYSIERKWFKKGNRIEKQFWVYELAGKDIKFNPALSENWADYVESFFPTQVAPFFFFDGEKIEALADFEKSGDLVHAAIHGLLGLNLVNQLELDLLTLEKKKHKDLGSEDDEKSIELLSDQLRDCHNRIDELKTEEAQLNNEHDELNKQLELVEIKFRQQGGALYEQRFDLEKQLRLQHEELANQEAHLRDIASGTAPLSLVKHLLLDINAQALIEENAHREELLCGVLDGRDQALMDRLAKQVTEKSVIADMASYLREDRRKRSDSARVEKYLGLDSDGQRDLSALLESELPALGKTIPEVLIRIKTCRDKVEATNIAIGSIPDESKIASIIVERVRIKTELSKSATTLKVVNEEIERAQRQYDQKNIELRRELVRAADARFEGKDTRRMLQYASKVRETLEQFRDKVIEKHIGEIEVLVLQSFKNLLRKDKLVEKLRIDRSNYQVRLYDGSGSEIMPERLSAGERQLLATALLWGICQAAGKPLPTIIDTPMGRLDTSHRTKLIENYFPSASHQVLLLSTNEEIVGQYYEKLRPYIARTWVLRHSESKGGTIVRQGYFN